MNVNEWDVMIRGKWEARIMKQQNDRGGKRRGAFDLAIDVGGDDGCASEILAQEWLGSCRNGNGWSGRSFRLRLCRA